MKVTVKEIREAVFSVSNTCTERMTYKVYINDVYEREFYEKASVDNFIMYLREIKKDYEKVIMEVEI